MSNEIIQQAAFETKKNILSDDPNTEDIVDIVYIQSKHTTLSGQSVVKEHMVVYVH